MTKAIIILPVHCCLTAEMLFDQPWMEKESVFLKHQNDVLSLQQSNYDLLCCIKNNP